MNPKFLAIVTEVAGGGAFVVLPIDKVRKSFFFNLIAPRLFLYWYNRYLAIDLFLLISSTYLTGIIKQLLLV